MIQSKTETMEREVDFGLRMKNYISTKITSMMFNQPSQTISILTNQQISL
jgi:hypothetical protein